MNPAVTWTWSSRRLQLHVNERVHAVPRNIAQDLVEHFPAGLTAHADLDLLDLERHYRALTVDQEQRWDGTTFSAQHTSADSPDTLPPWRFGRFSLGIPQWNERATRLHEARRKLLELRSFILSLGIEDGRLGRASRGWARSPDRPASVTDIWPDAAHFVQDDSRRGVQGHIVAGAVDATLLGFGWRRDNDDDPQIADVEFSGTWSVGYVTRTRELYAQRFAPHRSEELWLLGSELPPTYLPRVRQLHRRAREPNSLNVLARAVEVAGSDFLIATDVAAGR